MKRSHLLLIFLVVLIWGFNFLVIKLGFQDFSPIFLCFMRLFLTAFPAVFLIKFPPLPRKEVFYYGLFMFALPFSFLFMGIHTGFAPGLASLLIQSQTFFTILFAILFLKERLNRWQVVALIVAFTGIGFAGFNIQGDSPGSGFFCFLASAFFWGVGNLRAKKIAKDTQVLALVVWGSLFTLPLLLALSLFLEGIPQIFASLARLSLPSLGALAYIVYAATLFGYGTWSWLLSSYRLPMIAPFTLLVPIIGITSSALITGESLHGWKLISALLVILGLCFNLLSFRSEQPANMESSNDS